MLKVRYPIIVEGRYDKSRLASVIEGDIITTEGFGIFSDKRKLDMIRRLAQQDKIIILTDSDRAGFRIRGYIAGAVPPERIINVYIPQIEGKEHRKAKPSAEGTLGVEGIPQQLLAEAFARAGVDCGEYHPTSGITKQDMYELGLVGQPNSARMRRELLASLGLPQGLSANAMPGVLSRLTTPEELRRLLESMEEQAR